MLWCLRVMVLVVPLGLGLALLWMIKAGRQLEFRSDEALVFSVSETIERVNPLMPSRGADWQLETMIFDRLFRRDDELVLRGNLAESWAYQQQIEFFFSDKKLAAKAEVQVLAQLVSDREKGIPDKIASVSRLDAALKVSVTTHDNGSVRKVLGYLKGLEHLPVLKVRLSMKDAVRESWADFKKGSAEKGQIKREWIEGNQAVVFFVAGDIEQFLKELRLYYESNRNLDPEITLIEQTPCLDVAEWVMELRSDAFWHDGRPFTARDVLFSYEEMMRPAAGSALSGEFSHVASVRDLDSHRILVECRQFYAPIAESWERLPILPSHLLAGKERVEWEEFFERPVGTGPFLLESNDKNEEWVLKRNPKYFRGVPQQEEVKFKLVKNHEDRSRLIRVSSIDGFWPSEKERRLMRAKAKFKLLNDSFRQQTFVAWNLSKPIFQKEETRQALAHFMDVNALIDSDKGDAVRLCRGIFYPEIWYCKELMSLPEYNPEKGRSLLERSGWRYGEDGWMNDDGVELSFKLLVDQDSPSQLRLAETLRLRWREHGVSVSLLPMSWSDLVMGQLHSRNFDAALVGWELGYGRDQYRIWHSSQTGTGGGNFFGVNNESVDQILEGLRTETELEKIKNLAVDLQEKILQLQPCLFLTESAEIIVLRNGAVRLSRPEGDGVWTDEIPATSSAGLQNEWLWWRSSRVQE